MGRWSIRQGGRVHPVWLAKDFGISLAAGLLLFPAHGAEIACMSTFFAGGVIGFVGLLKRRLHVVMIGLALAVVAAGCQAVTIPDVQRHSLLFSAAWVFIAIDELMAFLAVSARGVK